MKDKNKVDIIELDEIQFSGVNGTYDYKVVYCYEMLNHSGYSCYMHDEKRGSMDLEMHISYRPDVDSIAEDFGLCNVMQI